MRKLLLFFVVVFVPLLSTSVALAQVDRIDCPAGAVSLTVAAGTVGNELEVLKQSLAMYTERCPNVTISALESPDLVTDRLGLYMQFLGARSDAVDIYAIDVIWPAIVADHMVNLYDHVDRNSVFVTQHTSALIENNTVDGRLVALPWYVDTGLLYYRADLLDKYGLSVPRTWDDLEAAARVIQTGERDEGNEDFWGYVWQGALGESTIVNGLEWQASEGGGVIISPTGEVQVNNAPTIRVMERAAGWVSPGGISPPEVTRHGPEDTRRIWQNGNAAFMRNWSYAFNLGNEPDSPIRGAFGVAPLPAGAQGVAATFGGWNLAVARYSQNTNAAVSVVQFLTSSEQQRFRAMAGGYNPTILSVYDDAEVMAANPHFQQLFATLNQGGAVARPSTVAAGRYNEVSRLYASAVHPILRGEVDARTALDELEFNLEDLVIELGF